MRYPSNLNNLNQSVGGIFPNGSCLVIVTSSDQLFLLRNTHVLRVSLHFKGLVTEIENTRRRIRYYVDKSSDIDTGFSIKFFRCLTGLRKRNFTVSPRVNRLEAVNEALILMS